MLNEKKEVIWDNWRIVKGEKDISKAVIEIHGREWFDKVNGNSYHCSYITIFFPDGRTKHLTAPFQYGYGDQYIHTAHQLLIKTGYIKVVKSKNMGVSGFRFFNKHGIRITSHKEENCLKRQLATDEEI